MSYVMASNDVTAVKLENTDRRYAIFYTGDKHLGDFDYWAETADLFDKDETAGAVYDYLMKVDLSGFNVQKFPVTDLREIMLENERPPEEMFLTELAANFSGDSEWKGSNQELYRLYSQWCSRYEMRAKSAIVFGRLLTTYTIRGWIAKTAMDGIYGKVLFLDKIRVATSSQ